MNDSGPIIWFTSKYCLPTTGRCCADKLLTCTCGTCAACVAARSDFTPDFREKISSRTPMVDLFIENGLPPRPHSVHALLFSLLFATLTEPPLRPQVVES